MMMNISTEGRRDGSAEGGGIDWHTFVKMAKPPTRLCVQPGYLARLYTRHACCRYITHPFRSLSTTYATISMSVKKMKKDYYLHSSGAIVSVTSALQMAVPNLRNFVMANEEFPILKHLIIVTRVRYRRRSISPRRRL